MASALGSRLLDHFAALRDPHRSWKVVEPAARSAAAQPPRRDRARLRRPETTDLPVLDTTDGAHGRIERRRHVVFHEDLNRLGSGHGQQTMATVRPISLDLLGGAEDEHSLEVRRTSAAWDDGDRDAIIRQTA